MPHSCSVWKACGFSFSLRLFAGLLTRGRQLPLPLPQKASQTCRPGPHSCWSTHLPSSLFCSPKILAPQAHTQLQLPSRKTYGAQKLLDVFRGPFGTGTFHWLPDPQFPDPLDCLECRFLRHQVVFRNCLSGAAFCT